MDKEKFLRSIPLEILEDKFKNELFFAAIKKCWTWRELQESNDKRIEDYKNELIEKAYNSAIDDVMDSHNVIDLYCYNAAREGTEEYKLNFKEDYIIIKYDLVSPIPPEQMARYLLMADETDYGVLAVIRCLLLYNSEDAVREGIKVYMG